MLGDVALFTVRDEALMAAALRVRIAVFVDEQSVPIDDEIDDHDRTDDDARHALLRAANGSGVATGRYFRREASIAQIGRIAVARTHRRAGLGRRILDALVVDARARGFGHVTLNAQDHAVDFYARAGFVPYSDTVIECGIVHQPMERGV